MTDEELNKRIREIMGRCWHIRSTNECIVCHKILIKSVGRGNFECLPANVDFVNTWEGFGLLWEFMRKHEQRHGFWELLYEKAEIDYREKTHGKFGVDAVKFWQIYLLGLYTNKQEIISPPVFSRAVVEFFEEK